jgi:hypothetical protein
MRIKCQMAATKVLQHIGVYSLLHAEFRSSFGTVSKASAGFEPSLEMAEEPGPKGPLFALTPIVEDETVGLPMPHDSAFIRA